MMLDENGKAGTAVTLEMIEAAADEIEKFWDDLDPFVVTAAAESAVAAALRVAERCS